MQYSREHQPTFNSRRRGIATLEFAMALPVLLLLMVAITWLGFSVIGQSEVLVEARNAAWKRRFENLSDKPLVFPLKVTIPGMPQYSQASDFVTETASKKVDVSPIFKLAPGPKAGHTVLAGSWDWRAMPLTNPPNWDLLGIAAVNGTTGKFQNLLSQLDGDLLVETLKKVAKDALKQAIQDATKDSPELQAIIGGIESYDGGDWQGVAEEIMKQIVTNAAKDNKVLGTVLDALGLLDDSGGSNDSKLGNPANAQSSSNNEQQKRNEAHAAELAAVVAEIKATQAEIDGLNKETKPAENNQEPPAANDQQKQAEDAKKQQLEYLNGKLKRLNSAKSDIERGPDLDGAYE